MFPVKKHSQQREKKEEENVEHKIKMIYPHFFTFFHNLGEFFVPRLFLPNI